VRGDLVRILGELLAKKEAGTLNFDRVIIETTGLADPAPVAQTFFLSMKILLRNICLTPSSRWSMLNMPTSSLMSITKRKNKSLLLIAS
jgi:hypothetical protein